MIHRFPLAWAIGEAAALVAVLSPVLAPSLFDAVDEFIELPSTTTADLEAFISLNLPDSLLEGDSAIPPEDGCES